MKYLEKYNQYLITESSKNNPIPELDKDKLAIILLGAPGVGKSTFINKQILKYKKDIKVFSTDNVSYTFTKDPNEYKSGSAELNYDRMKFFVKSNKETKKSVFIYDTTGANRPGLSILVDLARKNGYKVVFIHIMGTLDLSIRQNSERERTVDLDFIKKSYDSQADNIQYFSRMAGKSYYIIYNIDGKYKFMKYQDGKMFKRKVDKYVPLLNESVNIDGGITIRDIYLTFIDLSDEGYELSITDIRGSTVKSIDDVNDDFNITSERYNKKVTKFTLVIRRNIFTFDNIGEIVNTILGPVDYLKSKGIILSDFAVGDSFSENEYIVDQLSITFYKEEKIGVSGGLESNISRELLANVLSDFGIDIEELIYYDNYIRIIIDYGDLSAKDLDKIVDLVGAIDYDFNQ